MLRRKTEGWADYRVGWAAHGVTSAVLPCDGGLLFVVVAAAFVGVVAAAAFVVAFAEVVNRVVPGPVEVACQVG